MTDSSDKQRQDDDQPRNGTVDYRNDGFPTGPSAYGRNGTVDTEPPAQEGHEDKTVKPPRYFRKGETILGRYEVVEVLGQGGMGVVYRCLDLVGKIDVAVKSLPPQVSHNPAEMEDVRDNYTLVTGLSHLNIANYKTLERDDDTGDYYLVMDYVEGENLRQWIRQMRRERRLTLETALPVLRQVAEALDAAHRQGVIHRDIKPDNVKIRADGTVKVLDFGLAAQIRSSMARLSNETVARAGTNIYKSPEQWLASTQQGDAADQYSLAVTAYEMLSGHVPFESDDMSVLMKAVMERMPESIEGIPSYANTALMAGLAKEASSRYATCVDFVRALGGENVKPRGCGRGGKKSRCIGFSIVLIAVLIVLAGGYYVWKGSDGEGQFAWTSVMESSVSGEMTRQWTMDKELENGASKTQPIMTEPSVVIDDGYYRLKGSLKEFYDNIFIKHKDEWDRGQTFEEHITNFENNYLSGMGAAGSNDQKAYGFFKEAENQRGWLVASIPKRENAFKARRNAESALQSAMAVEVGQYAYNDLQKAKAALETAIKEFEEGRFDDAQKDFTQAEEMFKVAERNAKDAHVRQLVNQISDYIGFNHEDDAQTAINKLKELDQEKAAEQQIKLNAALQAKEERLREERLKQLEPIIVSALKKDDLERVKGLMAELKKLLKDTTNIDEWISQSARHWDAEAQWCLGLYYEKGKIVKKDMSKAVELLRKSADQGYAPAQNDLGMCYLDGKGVEKNVSQAVEWFSKAVEQDNAAAQCNLGWCYEKGYGVEKDVRKAVEWYRKSVEQGYAEAQNDLGMCYLEGKGVEKNVFKAVELFSKAAGQEWHEAQYNLGYCYEKGYGVEKDVTMAVEWYRKSAGQRYALAQNALGVCYLEGKGVEKNVSIAVELFSKAVEQDSAYAQGNLGFCYYTGTGVAKNPSKAVELFRKSAEKGFAMAQHYLGYCYENGTGVVKNLSTAVEWYRKSADQGYALSQNALGVCYLDGKGVEKDVTKAVDLFRKSAEQECAVAQANLGLCYSKGVGVEKNSSRAVELCRKSAEKGCALGQAYLGGCYLAGEGVKEDMTKAVELFRKSAEQECAEAQAFLGVCYLFGKGVETDISKSVVLFHKSAEKEVGLAQLCLGACYEQGIGVEKNLSKAVEWYRKAAAQGFKEAEERLKEISK